ncbi:rhodanese-like domain-containing protein [Tropicibacter sp. R15_0]|uniref:rhodanese-like domain-containing protein n=1 Tax=Tropicibacter sp. R15_0 TaxID=2821101 RepID=UPI00336A271F
MDKSSDLWDRDQPHDEVSDMALDLNRRQFVLGAHMTVLSVTASPLLGQSRTVWSAERAFDALLADSARVIDVRTREEWQESGVGSGVWPISMHEASFPERLFRAKELSGERTVGLICATGGRSASLLRALRQAGYSGYADIAEGMLGSGEGPGWIASSLPTVPMDVALDGLPPALA